MTGVQTCALPISFLGWHWYVMASITMTYPPIRCDVNFLASKVWVIEGKYSPYQDILANKLLCPDLLSLLKINIPTRILRSTHFLSIPFHSTNYGRYEPLTNCTDLYNEYCQYLDFNVPRSVWKLLLKSVFYSS